MTIRLENITEMPFGQMLFCFLNLRTHAVQENCSCSVLAQVILSKK